MSKNQKQFKINPKLMKSEKPLPPKQENNLNGQRKPPNGLNGTSFTRPNVPGQVWQKVGGNAVAGLKISESRPPFWKGDNGCNGYNSQLQNTSEFEEFPRVETPDLEERIDEPQKYTVEARNEIVRNWKPIKLPDTLDQPIKKPPVVCYDSCNEDPGWGSDQQYDGKRYIDVIILMLEDEARRRFQLHKQFPREMGQEEHDDISANGIRFCYLNFQKCLQANWLIEKITRLEKYLIGEKIEDVPRHLLEMEMEFEKMYGPVDQSKEEFQGLLRTFKLDRLGGVIEMLEHESKLLEEIIAGTISDADRSRGAKTISKIRTKVEAVLSSTTEANVNMNPFLSPLRMDFFMLPRPQPSVQAYDIHIVETEKFVEFQLPSNSCYVEGFNPAVLDIGVMYEGLKIVNGFQWLSADPERRIKDIKKTRQIFALDLEKVRKMRRFLTQFQCGIEEKRFFCKFKDSIDLFDDEKLFYHYPDTMVRYILSDVFYTQTLVSKSDERLILFPALLEGLIEAPRNILEKVWKRVRFLLKHSPGGCFKLSELIVVYKGFFSQPIYPLEWGFSNLYELVTYCFGLFPEECADIILCTDEEVNKKLDEKLSLDNSKDHHEKENDSDTDFKDNDYIYPDDWTLLQEPYDPEGGTVFRPTTEEEFSSNMTEDIFASWNEIMD